MPHLPARVAVALLLRTCCMCVCARSCLSDGAESEGWVYHYAVTVTGRAYAAHSTSLTSDCEEFSALSLLVE